MALADFLNTFNNINASKVYALDSAATFKVDMKYYANSSVADNSSKVSHQNRLNIKDLSPFVQDIQLPGFKVAMDSAETLIGDFKTARLYLVPDSNEFSMRLVNTQVPLIENWIYPWMREITSSQWVYDERPYTIATVEIDAYDHSNVKYVLNGVRPSGSPTMTLTHEVPGDITRRVSFAFDFMYLKLDKSMLKNSTASQITALANKLTQKLRRSIGLQ